jgi:hypothetical protein
MTVLAVATIPAPAPTDDRIIHRMQFQAFNGKNGDLIDNVVSDNQ